MKYKLKYGGKRMSNDEDKLVSIWRHKKTGEYIIALMAGAMERLTYKKFIDKNDSEWIFFNPLETTCKSGEIELASMGSDFENDIKKLGIDKDEIKDFRTQFIQSDKNFDEYGTDRDVKTAFTKLWKVNNIRNKNKISQTLVNKNIDFSYVGMNPSDSCGTIANDFWRRFFDRACESNDSKYMLFYKHMNLEPFLRNNDWTSLNTSLSMGTMENLRKRISDKGHFIGCDDFIYDFKEIYSKQTVDLYKKYINFILDHVLKDDTDIYNNVENGKNNEHEQMLASEIINHISSLDSDYKNFIETNQVKYNSNNGRFEMNVGKYRRDATAWIYSKFFPKPENKCKRYQFVTNKTKEEFEQYNSQRNVSRYEDLIGSNEFNEIKKIIGESWFNQRGKLPACHEQTNFDFISNIVKYFSKDFDNIGLIDPNTAKDLENTMNSNNRSIQISDFFSEPKEIVKMLQGEPSSIDGNVAKPADDLFGEYIRYSKNDILTFKGKQLVGDLKRGFVDKKNFCKNNEEFEKYFSIAVARALFETFQEENANYNDFIKRLRVYISFMFKKETYQLATKHKNFDLYKLSELKKSFYPAQRKIEEIAKERQQITSTTNSLSENDRKKAGSRIKELQNTENLVREQMNSMFLTAQDFDFLQKSEAPIINEDGFNRSNNKLLEVIKNKIDETDIIKLAKSKFGLSENNDKLQQGEEQLKIDLYEDIAKNIKYVTDYDDLINIIEKAIIDRLGDNLSKAIFDMISGFKKYAKTYETEYRENTQVMRVYQFIQHVFNAVGYLAFEKCNEKDLQMIIFNREEFIFQLSKNRYEEFLIPGKNAFDSLVINLIKGTSLQEKGLAENIAWIKDMVRGLDEKTVGAEEMSQFSLAAFNKKNRMLGNGFFSNKRKNNAIQTFFIPLQTIENHVLEDKYKIWTKEIKPKLGSKIKMADLNKKCGLTLSDNWEQVSADQMIKDSKTGWIPDKSYRRYDEEEDVGEDIFKFDDDDQTEIKISNILSVIENESYTTKDIGNVDDKTETKMPMLRNFNNIRLHICEKIIYFVVAFIILMALIISLIKLNIMLIIITSILLFVEIIFVCVRLVYARMLGKNNLNDLNPNQKFCETNDFDKYLRYTNEQSRSEQTDDIILQSTAKEID